MVYRVHDNYYENHSSSDSIFNSSSSNIEQDTPTSGDWSSLSGNSDFGSTSSYDSGSSDFGSSSNDSGNSGW